MSRTPWRKAVVLCMLAAATPQCAAEPWRWGQNNHGQLADGTNTDRPTPIGVPQLPFITLPGGRVASCSTGPQQVGCIDGNGVLSVAGRGSEGQLGTGTTSDQSNWVTMTANLPGAVSSVAMGGAHTAVISNGDVFTTGNNLLAQLGRADGTFGTFGQINGPAAAGTLPAYTSGSTWVNDAGAAYNAALAITSTLKGVVYTWGSNKYGQLGRGAIGDTAGAGWIQTLAPGSANMPDEDFVTSIHAGHRHCGVLTNKGRVFTWGDNSQGQLGTGSPASSVNTPQVVNGLPTVTKLSCGGFCGVITQGGDLYTWGPNNFGQLGDGTTTDRNTPTKITGGVGFPNGVTLNWFSAGAVTAGAIANPSRYLYTWGSQSNGALGNGQTSGNINTPQVLSVGGDNQGSTYLAKKVQMSCAAPNAAEMTDMQVTGLGSALYGYAFDLSLIPVSPSPAASPSPRPSPAASPVIVVPGAGCGALQNVISNTPGWANGLTAAQWNAWFNQYGDTVCGTTAGNVIALSSPAALPIAVGANGLTARGEIPGVNVQSIGSATRMIAQCFPPNPASSAYANFGVTAPSYASNALLYFICNFVLFDAAGNIVPGPLTLQQVSQFNLDRPTYWTAANTAGQLLTNAGGTFSQVGSTGTGRIFQLFDPIGTVLAVYYAEIPSPSPLPSPSPRPSPLPSPFPSPKRDGDGSDTALLGLLGLLGLPFLCLACYCCLWALYLLSKLKKLKKCMCEQQMAMQPSSYAPMQQEVYYVDVAQPMMAGTPTYIMDGGMGMGMEMCPSMPTGFAPMVLA